MPFSDRAHRVLADAEAQVAAAALGRARSRRRRRSAVVDRAEVGGAADEPRDLRGERVRAPCPRPMRVATGLAAVKARQLASQPAGSVAGERELELRGELGVRGLVAREGARATSRAAASRAEARLAQKCARPRRGRGTARPDPSRAPPWSAATSSSPSGEPWAADVSCLLRASRSRSCVRTTMSDGPLALGLRGLRSRASMASRSCRRPRRAARASRRRRSARRRPR